MIHVLIVEDEELAALRLQKMLLEIDAEIKVVEILDSVETSVKWLNKNALPDLLFLDIQLSDGVSFEIFNQIKIECPVVFVTAYDAYALKAFEVNSIDYLLKPLRKELLQNSIEKFKKLKNSFSSQNLMQKVHQMMEQYSQNNKSFKTRFAINKADTIFTIKADEIAYFYVEDKATFLVQTTGSKYIINYSLDQLEQILDPKQFYRLNRQFLTSLDAVEKVHNHFNYKLKVDLKPKIDAEIIVSNVKTVDFKNWLDW